MKAPGKLVRQLSGRALAAFCGISLISRVIEYLLFQDLSEALSEGALIDVFLDHLDSVRLW